MSENEPLSLFDETVPSLEFHRPFIAPKYTKPTESEKSDSQQQNTNSGGEITIGDKDPSEDAHASLGFQSRKKIKK